MKLNSFNALAAVFAITLFASCAEETKNQRKETKQTSLQVIRITEPTNGKLVTKGEKVDITLKLLNESVLPDSTFLFIDSQNLGKFQGNSKTIETETLKLGTRQIRATAWLKGERQTVSVSIMVKPSSTKKKT